MSRKQHPTALPLPRSHDARTRARTEGSDFYRRSAEVARTRAGPAPTRALPTLPRPNSWARNIPKSHDISDSGWLWASPPSARCVRLTVIVVALVVGIGPLATQSNAQSPNPALLAPGHSGRMLAQPERSGPRPTYTSPRPGGTPPNMMSRRGHRLSHPRAHNH
jgi:hypothetical protein